MHDCVSFVPLVSALVPLVSALIVELSLSSTGVESLCMLTRRGKQKKGLTVQQASPSSVLCSFGRFIMVILMKDSLNSSPDMWEDGEAASPPPPVPTGPPVASSGLIVYWP